jgi:dsRNA-specific ribonuclease
MDSIIFLKFNKSKKQQPNMLLLRKYVVHSSFQKRLVNLSFLIRNQSTFNDSIELKNDNSSAKGKENDDIILFKKPIETESDLLLREICFLVKDSDSKREIATSVEQDRNQMLIYALKPISLTDKKRRELVLNESFSYVSKRIIQTKQLNILINWVQTNFFARVFKNKDLIDPHLVKCFVSRTMLKRRERNLVYEFNRSNLQLELQGISHLDYILSRYLREFLYSLNCSSDSEDTILMNEQIMHIKSLMMHEKMLSLFAKSIGIDDQLLSHFQDIPKQRTGVDILLSIIGQTSNLVGIENSRLFFSKFMIPKLLLIVEQNPVPEIKTHDEVWELSRLIYNQDPVIQTREYKLKKPKDSIIYSTLILVNKQIKGRGLSQSMDQSKSMALRDAYEQLRSEKLQE